MTARLTKSWPTSLQSTSCIRFQRYGIRTVRESPHRFLVPIAQAPSCSGRYLLEEVGQWELWQKSLADGREAPVITDDYSRAFPQWSLDGMQLAYTRSNTNENKNQLMVWSRQSHSEEPLTSTSSPQSYLRLVPGRQVASDVDSQGNLDAAPCFRTPR